MRVKVEGMSTLRFLGAAGRVTGSGYLLTLDSGRQLLIDLGMFQGTSEEEALNQVLPMIEVERLDAVFLTHAHLDHVGRLPLLAKLGYSGPIYMTPATEELAELTLADAAMIASREDEGPPLFLMRDVEAVMRLAVPVGYNQEFSISGCKVTFIDAGHILGSASVSITLPSKKVLVFSGDLGNTPEPLVKPTQYFTHADAVVMESTYGDRLHEATDATAKLGEYIREVERFGGTLLIPAFSLERTQVLLHMIDHLKKDGVVQERTLVFLDSPMALKATEIYRNHMGEFNSEIQIHAKKDDPFAFPGLVLTPTPRASKTIMRRQRGSVIIAGSGMMSGGRILHHAKRLLGHEETVLLFVGFQAEGTIGREILEGREIVNIYGTPVVVRARIEEISSISAHADQGQLVDWFTKLNGVKQVFLTHGEDGPRTLLSEKLEKKQHDIAISLPIHNEEVKVEL